MTKFLERNYKSVSWILGLLFVLYLFCMFIDPWFRGGWEHVHAVWYDWQALNVGLLAFAATVILFNISRFQASQQMHRELIAQRAFMPEALSELNDYCATQAAILMHLYQTFQAERNEDSKRLNQLRQADIHLPSQPIKYRQIFSQCISLADIQLSEYLAYILQCMQVHNSRLSGMRDTYIGGSPTIYTTENVLDSMVRLCEIHLLINNLYENARGEESFTRKKLTIGGFNNAISGLHLLIHQHEILVKVEPMLVSLQDDWRLGWPKRPTNYQ